MATQNQGYSLQQTVNVKPKLPGFFTAFVLFSLPGFFTGLVWLIISIVFLFSFIGTLIFSSTDNLQTPLTYRTVQDSSSSEAILIYDLNGAITTGASNITDVSRVSGIYTTIVERDFEKIKNDDTIKNVVFRMNTPGGTVFASEVLGDLISDLVRSKGQEEAVFYFDQVVASGGLWATYKNQNNFVVGSPYGLTGSIGVVLTLPNLGGLADKVGYSETVIKSGPSKDIGNPFRNLSQEEQEFLQGQVDQSYDQFVEIVASGRSLEEPKVREFANGFVYDNSQAKDFGLLDEIASINTAIERSADNADISEYRVLEIETARDPFGGFLGNALAGTLNGAGISQQSIENITGRLNLEPGVVYAVDPTRI